MNKNVVQALDKGSVDSASEAGASPERVVRPLDAVGLIVGIVIGAGIFRTPSIVAANAASTGMVYLAWISGGVLGLESMVRRHRASVPCDGGNVGI